MLFLLASSDLVTADATVVLAVVAGLALIFNAVLAYATFKLYGATQDMAKQTEATVKAANAEAAASLAAVVEMREDRVLRARPYLVFRHRGVALGAPRVAEFRTRLSNVGPGAAINIHYAAYSRGKVDGNDFEEIGFGSIDAVAPGSTEEAEITYPGDMLGSHALDGYLNPDFPTWSAEVAVCRDAMGNWYRFIRGRGSPQIVAREHGPPPWGKLIS